jgi:murein L,D-transpeptidase YcbB/YkuD
MAVAQLQSFQREQLLALFNQAPALGLRSEDYLSIVQHAANDSIDDRYVEAAIHFFSDVIYGNETPAFTFNGLKYAPDCYDIPALVADAIEHDNLPYLLPQIEPRTDAYRQLKDLLIQSRTSGAHLTAVQKAIHTIRWLHCLQQKSPVIVVNIPSASLLLYENGQIVLESKLVVGRQKNPTPVFCGMINEVNMYPWYLVPNDIAVKEALPQIKRSTQYIEDNNLQVLDTAGQLVNPYTINWKTIHAANFPFTLRQATSCDNSLGQIKFSIEGLPGIYLHDTPWNVLFKMNGRYLSRGCIRVEKAVDLGRHILKGATAVLDTLQASGNLLNKQPVPVAATMKMPVVVVYNTVWFDAKGVVRFYDDVYSKF